MPPKRTAKKPSTSSRVTNKIKDEFADAIKDSYTPKELDEMQRWQLQEIAKRLRLHNLAMIAANQSEDKIRKDLKEHYRRRRAPTTEVPPPAQAPAGTGTGTSAAEHARTGTTPPGYPLTVPPSTGSTPVPIPDEQPADAGASAADSQATHTPSTPPGYPTHAPPSTGTTPAPVLIEQSSGARAGAADTQATHTPSTPPGYPADAPPSTGTTPAPLPNQQSTDAGSATADASIQTDRIRDPSPCAGHVTDHRPCRASLNAAEATIANQRETITDARATIAHQRAEIDEASQRIAKLRDTITALRQDRNVAKLRHLRRENEEGRQLAQELFNNQKTWATSMGSMRIDLTEALDIAKSYKRQLEIATAQANRMEAQLDMYRRVYQRDKTRSERERSTYVSERDTYPYRDNQASHQDHRGHPSGIGPVRRGRSRSPSAPYSCPPAPRPSHRPTPSTSGSGFDPSATGRPDPSRFTGSQFPPSLERNADGTQTFFVRSTRTTHGFGAGYRPPPGSESHHSTRHDPAGRPDFGYGASPYFEPTEDYASAPEAGSSTGFGTASEARTYGNPSGPSEFGIGAPPQHGAGFEYDTPSTYTGYPYYQPDSSSGGGPAPGSGAFPSGSGFGWSS